MGLYLLSFNLTETIIYYSLSLANVLFCNKVVKDWLQ